MNEGKKNADFSSRQYNSVYFAATCSPPPHASPASTASAFFLLSSFAYFQNSLEISSSSCADCGSSRQMTSMPLSLHVFNTRSLASPPSSFSGIVSAATRTRRRSSPPCFAGAGGGFATSDNGKRRREEGGWGDPS